MVATVALPGWHRDAGRVDTVGGAMQTLLNYARTLRDNEEGATMVEYAFMVSLVALAALVAVTAFGGGVLSLFELVVFP
jgi:Flp pilus assembly pilin Flp